MFTSGNCLTAGIAGLSISNRALSLAHSGRESCPVASAVIMGRSLAGPGKNTWCRLLKKSASKISPGDLCTRLVSRTGVECKNSVSQESAKSANVLLFQRVLWDDSDKKSSAEKVNLSMIDTPISSSA